MPVKLSVVIPVYNAQHALEQSIEEIIRILGQNHLTYEILLRDDASIDESKHILEEISSVYPQARCFYNSSNRGLGFTLRELFREAKGEIVIYCDGDLPFGAEILPILLDEIRPFDIVIASRYKGVKNHVALTRWMVSRFYYYLCKFLFNISARDIGSGSVAIKRDKLQMLNLKTDGFAVHAELYARAKRAGLTMNEIPAKVLSQRLTTFSILKHGLSTLWATIKLRFMLGK